VSIFRGAFEGAGRAAASAFLRADLDTRCGIGYISTVIARKLKPDRRFVAVEPDPRKVLPAWDNLQQIVPSVPAEVINAALNYNWLVRVNPFGGYVSAALLVQEVMLRDLVQRYFPGEYHLVMDIEGNELGLILKDAAALSKCRLIIAELHSSTAESKLYHDQDMIQILREYGFTKCRRVGAGSNYILEREIHV
jgi:FkbM family methyltransferase